MISTSLHATDCKKLEIEFAKRLASNNEEYFILRIGEIGSEATMFLSEEQSRKIARKIYDLLEGGE